MSVLSLNVYKLDGSSAGTVNVNENIFGIEPNTHVCTKF